MYGTGDNTSGQVGIGNGKKYVLEPQRLANPQNVSIIQAAKFSACICEGQLYVWGGATRQFVPYHIDSEMSFTELKAGNDSLMALSFKGELFSWQATIADSEVELKHFELKSKAILDFSIG
jgi:alpha-tubulin suppressor-like RCC1 family protein